jgi:hypothetical protein
LPPLPMPLLVLWVFPSPQLLPLRLFPLPLFPKPPLKLKKAAKKAKQNDQLASYHTALLAYLAGQGVVVPPHLAAGAGALTHPPQASSSITQPRLTVITSS